MPDQASSPLPPLQSIVLTDDDMKSPALLNTHIQHVTEMLNYILGHAGVTPVLKSGVDLGGRPITNTGAPRGLADVVTLEFAQNNYGAPALQPMFEALGKQTFQTFRQLNSRVQTEQYSSFLNGVINTTPTANTATVSATPPSSGTTTVTVSGGLHQYLDGSSVPFASRTDTLALPAQFGLVSLTRSSGIVTAVTIAPTTLVPDDGVGIGGVVDPTFDGSFVVLTAPSSTQFTYYQPGPNASTTGGGGSILAVYYYTIARGQNKMGLTTVTGADTWSARTNASFDGTTIIGVVVLTSGGIDPVNSAAGGTSPQSGANVPVVRRM